MVRKICNANIDSKVIFLLRKRLKIEFILKGVGLFFGSGHITHTDIPFFYVFFF